MKKEELLHIGFLYDHPFGKRVINHLINKPDFCKKCGPLCINCRTVYPWFAGKIKYAHDIESKNTSDLDTIWEEITVKLEEIEHPLDVLVIVGISQDILIDIPDFLEAYHIRAVIFPVEDGDWISVDQQLKLQQQLSELNIEFAFPRPFCSLEPQASKKIINTFIEQFKIGKPVIDIGIKDGKIQKTKIIRSAPCGATFFISQYLRNEQYNVTNQQSLDEKISYALDKYPCIASRNRDPVIEGISRIKANNIATETMKKALNNAEDMN